MTDNLYGIINRIDKIDNGEIKITFPEPIKFTFENYLLFGSHKIQILMDSENEFIFGIQGKPKIVLSWINSFTGILPSVKREYSRLISELDKKWLYLDEKIVAIKNLEILTNLIEDSITDDNSDLWPIIINLMHSTLQAFMVWALTGSTFVNVLCKKDAIKWLKSIDLQDASKVNVTYEEYHLDSFLKLYNKIKNEKYMNAYNISIAFDATNEFDKNIILLNTYRNDFIHFVPKLWQIEISAFPNILRSGIEIIDFLVFQSNTIFLPNELQLDKANIIKKFIDRCELSVNKIEQRFV